MLRKTVALCITRQKHTLLNPGEFTIFPDFKAKEHIVLLAKDIIKNNKHSEIPREVLKKLTDPNLDKEQLKLIKKELIKTILEDHESADIKEKGPEKAYIEKLLSSDIVSDKNILKLKIIEALLKKEVDKFKDNLQPFQKSCESAMLEVISELLKLTRDPSINDYSMNDFIKDFIKDLYRVLYIPDTCVLDILSCIDEIPKEVRPKKPNTSSALREFKILCGITYENGTRNEQITTFYADVDSKGLYFSLYSDGTKHRSIPDLLDQIEDLKGLRPLGFTGSLAQVSTPVTKSTITPLSQTVTYEFDAESASSSTTASAASPPEAPPKPSGDDKEKIDQLVSKLTELGVSVAVFDWDKTISMEHMVRVLETAKKKKDDALRKATKKKDDALSKAMKEIDDAFETDIKPYLEANFEANFNYLLKSLSYQGITPIICSNGDAESIAEVLKIYNIQRPIEIYGHSGFDRAHKNLDLLAIASDKKCDLSNIILFDDSQKNTDAAIKLGVHACHIKKDFETPFAEKLLHWLEDSSESDPDTSCPLKREESPPSGNELT